MSYRNPDSYKVLVLLLYGDYTWLTREPNGFIEMRTKPMAVLLNYPAGTIRSILRSLERQGYLTDLQTGVGYASLRMKPPHLLCTSLGCQKGV